MKISQHIGLLGAVLVLAGCAEVKPFDPQGAANTVQALVIPADLTPLKSTDIYQVPMAQTVSAVVAVNTPVAEVVVVRELAEEVILQTNDVPQIVIKASFDKSWRRVGLALERARWKLDDKDRNAGVYFLSPLKVKKAMIAYRVKVQDDGAACAVTIQTDGAADTGELLQTLYKNLQP